MAWPPLHSGHWILTRYDDCYDACRDWEVFSVSRVQVPRLTEERSIPNEIGPPEHKYYRDVLNPIFKPAPDEGSGGADPRGRRRSPRVLREPRDLS